MKKLKILILIVGIIIIVSSVVYLNKGLVDEDYERYKPEIIHSDEISLIKVMDLEGFTEAEVIIQESSIILKNKRNECEIFSAEVIDFQAYSILKGLEDKTETRPTIHDIVRDLIEVYEFEIKMVKVSEFSDGIYYGNLVIEKDGKILNLDIKPSDVIAIAVRTGDKIYISEKILREQGQKIC